MNEVVERPAAAVARARSRASRGRRFTGKNLAVAAALGLAWGAFLFLPLADAVNRFGI